MNLSRLLERLVRHRFDFFPRFCSLIAFVVMRIKRNNLKIMEILSLKVKLEMLKQQRDILIRRTITPINDPVTLFKR